MLPSQFGRNDFLLLLMIVMHTQQVYIHCSCDKTAPNPYEDVSEESFVFDSGLYSASTVGFESSDFED